MARASHGLSERISRQIGMFNFKAMLFWSKYCIMSCGGKGGISRVST